MDDTTEIHELYINAINDRNMEPRSIAGDSFFALFRDSPYSINQIDIFVIMCKIIFYCINTLVLKALTLYRCVVW